MQDFMAARPQDWACADEGKVLEKLRQDLSVTGRAAKVTQLLGEDCSSTAEEQCCALCVRPEPQYTVSALHPSVGIVSMPTNRLQHPATSGLKGRCSWICGLCWLLLACDTKLRFVYSTSGLEFFLQMKTICTEGDTSCANNLPGVQVMLAASGCQVNLHECVTLLRHLSGGQPIVVASSAIAALLHIPEPAPHSTFQQSNTMRRRAGDLKHQIATVCMLPLCPRHVTPQLSFAG